MQDFFTYYIRQQTILADVLDVNPVAVVFLQSLIFLLQPPNPAPAGPPSSASRGRLCCRAGLTPLLLPPLARISLYSPTSLQCCGCAASGSFPSWVFLGLTVIHRFGVLGTAWSTLSTNDNIGRGMYMERLIVGTHMVHGSTQASTSLLRQKE